MPDIQKVKRNVRKMIEQGAPDSDIEMYLESEKMTPQSLAEYSSNQKKTLKENVVDKIKEGVEYYRTENLSPALKAGDTFFAGVPRTLIRAYAPDWDKKIFPDQTTFEGKTRNVALQTLALYAGLAGKAALKAGSMIVPTVAKEGLKRKIARSAVVGAVGSGVQFYGEPADSILEQAGKQGLQALGGGVVGAAVPVAGEIIGKTKEAISDFAKGGKGYISDVIAPKMSAIIKLQISKMDPKFVSYVENKLRVPRRSLEVIRNKGEAVLDNVFSFTKGVASDIENRLRTGIFGRRDIADQAYQIAMDSVPESHVFQINHTRAVIKKGLVDKGILDRAGNVTERYKIATQVDKALVDIYDDMNRVSVAKKADFSFYRDKLSSLYKETGSTNREVFNATSALYDDAANSGFQSLQEARELQKAAFDIESRFSNNSLLNEKRLNNYNKWSAREKMELDELVSYIQDDRFKLDAGIIDDLESTLASADLQVLKNKTSPEAVRNDLLKAADKENFNTVKSHWANIIGEDAEPIFNEVSHAVAGQQIRSVVKSAALVTSGIGALGYGAYRLGGEGIERLLNGFGDQ